MSPQAQQELVIVFSDFGSGPVVGYTVGDRAAGEAIYRKPKESDDDLISRAVALEAKRRLPTDPVRLLFEVRSDKLIPTS